ncbi:hypothetical protein ACFLW8_06355 [Chloroflexota bacterium]
MSKYLSLGTLLACSLILSIACSSNNEGKISGLSTSKSIGDDQRPVEISSIFPPDSEIYCSFKTNVPRETFYYEVIKPEDGPLDGRRLPYSQGTFLTSMKYVRSAMIKSADAEWKEGNFLILLYLDDKQEGSISFTIK